ncbi:MAG: transcription antitermination factor NusB [Bacillota bacterium]|nr:transcription antitermination factor NusB [Bacillota bacterium]MDI9415742.1 transcription antitermination factor NusB [Bacillota bacterium]NLD12909.1 transcription antitermination factor NusB [Bacillota bacterium]HAV20762.1 transcription antitermination factor NusB [Bacillota bacterium]HOB88394.1 transcription antitermination factor NusB [Bacillota bacterium]
MTRRDAREAAFIALFQVDVGRMKPETAISAALSDKDPGERSVRYIHRVVLGTLENLEAIDNTVSRLAIGWTLDRMGAVDRNLLRLAVYEILFLDDIPLSVAINEAVSLAKKFGDEESWKFVNGILGKLARELKEE